MRQSEFIFFAKVDKKYELDVDAKGNGEMESRQYEGINCSVRGK